MSGKGRASLRSIGGGLLLLVGVLFTPAPALATPEHPFLGTFGSAGQPSFTKPEGLAIDQSTGDLLVIDAGAGTVSRWNPDGTPANFLALGSNIIDGKGIGDGTLQDGLTFGGPAEVQVAVDNSGGGATDGNIYVTDASHKLIDIFNEDGSFLGQLTKFIEGPNAEGPGEKAFSEPCGVAVDPDGNVYIGDYPGLVHKYEPGTSVPVNGDDTLNFAATEPCTLAAGAGPSAGSVFVPHFEGPVIKFDGSTGAEEYEVTKDTPNPNTTVTVDPATGNVYTASGQVFTSVGSAVNEYDASGGIEATLLSTISPPSSVWGVAVDRSSGNVYVAERDNPQIEVWGPVVAFPGVVTEEATEVGSANATLNGSVNPEGLPLKSCFFEYGETKSYGEIAPCEEPEAAEVGEGSAPVAVHADLEGLEVGTSYHFRLVAGNANGTAEGDDEVLTTLGPGIREEAASQISASGARITGEINPNGEASSFVVQYVSEAKFENEENEYAEATTTPISPKAVGSGTGFVAVALQLSGLAPDTTYHFRIVASNPAATNQGPDRTFTTMAEAPAGLPDGRAYEMVSPPQKVGEVFPPEPLGELGGSCPVECLPGTFLPMAPMQASPDGEEVLFTGEPFSAGLASGVDEYLGSRGPGGWETESLSSPLFEYEENQGYKAFSSDLSQGIVYQMSPALSVDAPSSEGKSYANLYRREGGVLEALVTQAPPQRTPGVIPTETRFEIAYGGANAGSGLVAPFSHVVFAANDALTDVTAFAPKAPEIEAGQRCRRSFGADCNLYEWAEGELRLVNVLPGKTAAPRSVIGSRLEEEEPPAVDQAISEDGSRIFWSDETGQLFVRIDGEETREIKAPGRFLTANPQGTKVLLGEGCLYDVGTELCEELTEGKGGFQGILGTAEDLSRVYFVDSKILSGEEENENEEKAVEEAGKFNLYLWEGGEVTYLGTLLGDDNSHGSGTGDWKAASGRRTAQVSPDGRFAAFMSKASLSGYDNKVSGSGPCRKHSEQSPLCNEVFEYDAEAGKLACVSCNPSGQRPIGESNLSIIKETVAIAAAPFPAPHNLTSDGGGRIFFESQDSLTPRDTNAGIQDVYEWEPAGIGSCERAGGCVYLISSGKAANDSMFLNSTPNGDDAFLISREQLLARDKNDQLDLYDARAPHVPGEALGFPEGETPPCSPEACAGPIPAPPAQPAPDSAGPGLPGNPKPKPACKKGFVRKHGKCVKKHKKHHKRHKRAAKHNRGGAR